MNSYPKVTNKRILVTGGAGFIGSNLCEDLLKNDNEVVCLDNFSTGRIENLKEFLDHYNAKPVPLGFKYNSGENNQWLTVDELREQIRNHVDKSFTF